MAKTNDELSIELHEKNHGKIATLVKTPVNSRAELSQAYTPGVAAVCRAIAEDVNLAYKYTSKANTVAVVTDGTAVLGLGDIGPEAALPVMEGKALLMKEFADVDAWPICLATKNVDEIVQIVTALAPGFGAINLEDISAPRCFEIENKLKETLNIPVFHDDQHGTAIVALAALINAFKITNRDFETAKFVISGAGAAGIATAKILLLKGAKNIIMTNSRGVISESMENLNWAQSEIASLTNPDKLEGTIADALVDADVFIGVSAPSIVTTEMVKTMSKDCIILAMANPIPEIMPDDAKAGGARIIGTGRSDFPNQVNNVLAFPGIFRGVLDAGVKQITEEMKLAASEALANYVKNPDEDHIIPDAMDKNVSLVVAEAIKTI